MPCSDVLATVGLVEPPSTDEVPPGSTARDVVKLRFAQV